MNEVDNLNLRYNFFYIENLKIVVRVNSLQKFANYNPYKKVGLMIENNEYGIKNQMLKTVFNRCSYMEYCEEYNELIETIKKEYIENEMPKLKIFLNILVLKMKKQKIKSNFKLSILLDYTSPGGRSHREKRINYSYDELFEMASKTIKFEIKEFIKTIKDGQNVKCKNCGGLIKSDSNYCTNCGTKVEKNANQGKESYQETKNDDIDKIKEVYNQNDVNKAEKDYDEKEEIAANLYDNNEEKEIEKIEYKEEIAANLYDNNEEKEIEKIEYKEEIEYLDRSNFVYAYDTIQIKLDDGSIIDERFSGFILTESEKSKYYHSKTEKILESYFTKKYLKKEIHNYEIMNIHIDLFPSTAITIKRKCIYFTCKCKKCGRIIEQVSDDFLVNPIKCNCCLEKNIEKKDIDLNWEIKLPIYVKRVYDNLSLLPNNEEIYYYDIYIKDYFTFYFKNNNNLKRAGLAEIKKFNAERNYIIGNVSIPFSNKYITFSNVYYYLGKDYIYGYRYTKVKNKYFNPILYYYDDENKSYDVSNYIKNNTIFEGKTSSYIFIYFEKNMETSIYDKPKYKVKVYNDNVLIFEKDEITDCKYLYKNQDYIVFSFNGKNINEQTDNWRFLIRDKKFEYFNKLYGNIKINIALLDNNLKKTILSYEEYDNSKYRRIYIHKSSYETGWILYEYLKKEQSFQIIKNEFADDKNPNYMVIIKREDKEKNNFIDYVIAKSKDNHCYECNIYEHSITSLCNILLKKTQNREKLINAVLEGIISTDNTNMLKKLNEYAEPYSDYIVEYFSYYKEIINKLELKYNTDDFGLILIMLRKYGENAVFPLNGFTISKENKEYEELYNRLLDKSEFKKTKWKSEYNLYLLVKCYFSDAIFQYKFQELGNQSLDIYIPSLKIGIEYQGQQHYENIGFFNQKTTFEQRKMLDNRKKEICSKNGITLIEWCYEDGINKFNLDLYLKKYANVLKDKYPFIK